MVAILTSSIWMIRLVKRELAKTLITILAYFGVIQTKIIQIVNQTTGSKSGVNFHRTVPNLTFTITHMDAAEIIVIIFF
jgi:hypothetical protein